MSESECWKESLKMLLQVLQEHHDRSYMRFQGEAVHEEVVRGGYTADI